ncbi:MAG: hypothetical protein BWY15_00416 [Firmicutes bacterium ADurb.Bin193]|nr:MAG: hypothetical protein BWY15_00416 [Firmicutes bacterium ADurb.Bin193]
MPYNSKTNWTENEIVNPSDMNRIEQGIKDLHEHTPVTSEISQDGTRRFLDVVTTSGNGINYAATLYPAPAGYYTGMTIILKPHVTSGTNTPTLNVNGLGAKNIARGNFLGGGHYDSSPSWFKSTNVYTLVYDGVRFIAINIPKLSYDDLLDVPTSFDASIITQDANHRFVTDAEKTTYSNKAPKTEAVVTGGTSSAFTATIPEISTLYDGLIICVRPHAASSADPTLNLNNTGAIPIVRYLSIGSGYGVVSSSNSGWLGQNRTVTLRFTNVSGTYYWIVLDSPKTRWDDILNTPTTFTPATHSHAWGSITNKPSDIMQRGMAQTMTERLSAGGPQEETIAQVRNAVILPAGTTDFSEVETDTLIFVKE